MGKFIYYSVGLANVVVLQPGLVDLGVPRDQSSESRLEGGEKKMRLRVMTEMTRMTAT